jgi:hypothetical protein
VNVGARVRLVAFKDGTDKFTVQKFRHVIEGALVGEITETRPPPALPYAVLFPGLDHSTWFAETELQEVTE